MLDRFQRSTVETVREHKGKITIWLDNNVKDEIELKQADERLNKDIAIALQGYYARLNSRYYGDESKSDL